ncbi:MAG: hypothetical protein V9E98_08690 [Candidatus Nanopelagicales bacterium]
MFHTPTEHSDAGEADEQSYDLGAVGTLSRNQQRHEDRSEQRDGGVQQPSQDRCDPGFRERDQSERQPEAHDAEDEQVAPFAGVGPREPTGHEQEDAHRQRPQPHAGRRDLQRGHGGERLLDEGETQSPDDGQRQVAEQPAAALHGR